MKQRRGRLLLVITLVMMFFIAGVVSGNRVEADSGYDILSEHIYPLMDKSIRKDKVNIIAWDADLEITVNIVLKNYPDLSSKINVINLGVMSSDATKAYKAILDGKYTGYTFIFASDIGDVAELVKKADALKKIGFNEADYADAYEITKKMGLVSGELHAICWQICPNSFFYNAAIAKSVLGTDDPEAVQEMISTPQKFNDVAKKMKEKGYYMTSGVNKKAIDENLKYVSYTENIYSKLSVLLNAYDAKSYDNGAGMWDEKWGAGFTNGTVFGYFGTNWMEGVIEGNNGKPGAFRVCEGPVPYLYGGTFLYVKDTGTQGADAAKFISALVKDEKVQSEISKTKGDFVNNSKANQKLASDSSMNDSFLGNQNPRKVWHSAALSLGGSTAAKAEWKNVDGKWYYVDANGNKATDWQKISGKWYFFDKKTGVMATGWQKISGKWYYFKGGVMQTGWKKLSGKWYFFKEGAMKTGWLKSGGKWYYFNSDGSMATGSKAISGKTYQFDNSGICLNP